MQINCIYIVKNKNKIIWNKFEFTLLHATYFSCALNDPNPNYVYQRIAHAAHVDHGIRGIIRDSLKNEHGSISSIYCFQINKFLALLFQTRNLSLEINVAFDFPCKSASNMRYGRNIKLKERSLKNNARTRLLLF